MYSQPTFLFGCALPTINKSMMIMIYKIPLSIYRLSEIKANYNMTPKQNLKKN